jgi:hypothetical protein
MYKFERMSRYILNEAEQSHHLILIRLYFILKILITEDDHNHIVLTIATQLFFFITYNKMTKYIAHCRNSCSIQ